MNQHVPKVPYAASDDEGEGPLAPRPVGGPVRHFSAAADSAAPVPSLTYEPYYGLKEKPFSLSADPRFLYKSPAHAPAFDELLYGIRRREGLIVLTGEIGTGKTTLIRSVLQHLDRRTFTAFVPDPFVSREDLLKMLLVDFGVVSMADLKRGSLAGATRPDLSYPLYEFLDSLVPLQAFAVLIIDEAQNLPLALLEEIRILSDLEQREKLLQVVLVGQPELRAHLKLPGMRQVDQRVSVRCELSPLGLEDVAAYVRHRLDVASGGERRVEFTDPAMATVFHGSGGVPRLINLICDRALQRGCALQAARIGPSLVKEAIRALGLEAPTATTSVPAAAASVPAATPEPASVWPSAATAPAPPTAVTAPPSPQRPRAPQRDTGKVPPVLSEFAAETELSDSPGRTRAPWVLAGLAAIAAVGATGLGLLLLASVGRVDLVPPPSPPWTSQTRLPSIDQADFPTGTAAGAPRAADAGRPERYSIQVASLTSRTRAERLVGELAGAGFQARAVEFDLGPPRGLLLQVRVDGYERLEDADRDLARIRALPGYADAHLLTN